MYTESPGTPAMTHQDDRTEEGTRFRRTLTRVLIIQAVALGFLGLLQYLYPPL